jgi:hypothetical protein
LDTHTSRIKSRPLSRHCGKDLLVLRLSGYDPIADIVHSRFVLHETDHSVLVPK